MATVLAERKAFAEQWPAPDSEMVQQTHRQAGVAVSAERFSPADSRISRLPSRKLPRRKLVTTGPQTPLLLSWTNRDRSTPPKGVTLGWREIGRASCRERV